LEKANGRDSARSFDPGQKSSWAVKAQGSARMAARQDEGGDDTAEGWEQKKRKNTVEWQKQLDERGLVEISENGKGLRLCALYRTSGDGRPPRAVTPNSSDEKWWRMVHTDTNHTHANTSTPIILYIWMEGIF
jgi:hypothetical protein